MKNHTVLLLGYGSIAKAHAYALNALPFYYDDLQISAYCVAGRNASKASEFARQYGFETFCTIEDISSLKQIDTVFILGPNKVHIPHLKLALAMDNVHKIYIEKPLFCSSSEERYVQELISNQLSNQFSKVQIQIGFQFLQSPPMRHLLQLLNNHDFGQLIHFRTQYLRSGYLDRKYHESRGDRLKPAPEGGAIADLGSHAFSLLIALLGDNLKILHTAQNQPFADVHPMSDLCSQITLQEQTSGAIGHVTASRISAGADDILEVELHFHKAALRFSSTQADTLHICSPDSNNQWTTIHCGNDYAPHSQFPQKGIASGWLRALVHAHFIFFTQADEDAFIPDLAHGLNVQRLIHSATKQLQKNTQGVNT